MGVWIKYIVSWYGNEKYAEGFFKVIRESLFFESALSELDSETENLKVNNRPGVYILFGDTDEGRKVYIGESMDVNKRIGEHRKKS